MESTADHPNAVLIDDKFIAHMFQIIEGLSDDVNDPYHYPVIRVLVRPPPALCRPPTANPIPSSS